MQISLLKHLKFPEPQPSNLAGTADDSAAGIAQSSGTPARGAPVRSVDPEAVPPSQTPSTIVNIRSQGIGQEVAAVATELVYTNKRNAPAVPEPAAEPEDHFVGTKSEVFVHFAVNTMRKFADEQERSKGQSAHAEHAGGAHLIPRSLGDIQKLASRFKMFA